MPMNSLSAGVWGSFSTPCSRALGGKSGMTRAAPLVCFTFGHTAPPAAPRSAERPHLQTLLLLILLTAWCSWVASRPPNDSRPVLAIAQEPTCQHLVDQQPTVQRPNLQSCEKSLARARERRSGSVQSEGASDARALRFFAYARGTSAAQKARADVPVTRQITTLELPQ
ncbi:conserved hypothetical protein [Pseudomonas sp. 8BK]|nr:conserved hypothetical protein [Pseudomonas sp. 8BK]